MCQSKTTGNGKRCLKHQAASTSTVHFSWAKTGVDKSTIYATLKELNKEGRKLDAPELPEVKAFLDKEEFVVSHDKSLKERDRKLILKNLDKARQEAATQAVSGGAFHAWKNIFSKTVEKIKKPFIAAGLVGVLAFSMAGCAGSLDNTPNGTNAPSPSSSSSAPVECSTENPGPWGDVIAKEEVTDEYGEYCRTTIDPNSDALKYDASKSNTAALEKHGFTEEDVLKAQTAAVTYLAEETLDSTRLDNYDQSATDWYKENSSYFSDDASFEKALKEENKSLVETGMLVTDNMPTPIVRNGDPRSVSTNIQVNSITAGTNPTTGESVLVIETGANANYDAKNADVVALILKNDSSITEESLKAEHPELFLGDNESSSGLFLQGTFTFGFDKDNVEKISGTSSSWTVSTVGGVSVVK